METSVYVAKVVRYYGNIDFVLVMCYYIIMSKEFLSPLENGSQPKAASFKKWRKISKILLSATMAISAIGYGYNQNRKIDRLQATINKYTNKSNTN